MEREDVVMIETCSSEGSKTFGDQIAVKQGIERSKGRDQLWNMKEVKRVGAHWGSKMVLSRRWEPPDKTLFGLVEASCYLIGAGVLIGWLGMRDSDRVASRPLNRRSRRSVMKIDARVGDGVAPSYYLVCLCETRPAARPKWS